MRVREIGELLERGHLVADGGARHTETRVFGDRFAAHRLAGAHVLLDHGVQHR
jgi:hypothetical protein